MFFVSSFTIIQSNNPPQFLNIASHASSCFFIPNTQGPHNFSLPFSCFLFLIINENVKYPQTLFKNPSYFLTKCDGFVKTFGYVLV